MRALRFLLIALLCLVGSSAYAATTLLPNGSQCFTDANGAVIAGSINMFFPATTTPKPTWKDTNQNTLNSQPIQLDNNGCAVIYGVGVYRQQLFDGPVVGGVTTGNLLFDQLTTDTSAFNAVFWAGINGGTPNVITVVDTGFNATDGTVINFTALATNTGSVTINPSGFGAISVVKDTAAGPVSLTGGEIVQNNIISVVYSASGNNFHLLNTAIPSASGNSAPLCGASNLKITNDAVSPSSVIDITADSVVMVSSGGQVINRSNVSTTVNISTGTALSTAGGMDGESPGTSSWVDVFLIDNGSAAAGLGSAAAGNAKAPVMPSGYIYKCFFGAMRVNSGGNMLLSTQRGRDTQYAVLSASTTTNYPSIGTTTNNTLTSMSVTSVVPPTAYRIQIVAESGTANSNMCVSPNNQTAAILSSTNPSAICQLGGAGNQIGGTLNLEGTTIFAATNSGGTLSVFAVGWSDQVNAN